MGTKLWDIGICIVACIPWVCSRKAKLCMYAYSPGFFSNFVVPYKRLNVRLCRRVNVKGHGSECCFFVAIYHLPSLLFLKIKLRGLSPRANYTDRAAAAGRRS